MKTPAGNLRNITPFLHVPAFDAALQFFRLLGFEPAFSQPGYAYLEREGFGIRILESRAEDDSMFSPHGGFSVYIDVADVDAEVARLRPALEAAGIKTVGPVHQRYHQREFMIRMPDGNVLTFGEAMPFEVKG